MKNSKKKLLVLALALCLIATLSFTTLAWFTDNDSATNTFTVGSVEINQIETDENGNPFVQDQVLLPVVNADPSADANYQYKVVSVENVGDNPAYVRTHIAVPTSLVGYLCLDMTDPLVNWTFAYSTEVNIGGVAHTVYTYTYTAELAPTVTTETLLQGVYLYAEVDVKTNEQTGNKEFCKWNNTTKTFDFSGFIVQNAAGTVYPVEVLVASEAVQAEGFANANAALDAAYGATTPWSN